MIFYLFFSCLKCLREDNKKYSYIKSIRSERNDGYAVFLDQYRHPQSLLSASCNDVNVSFIFEIIFVI